MGQSKLHVGDHGFSISIFPKIDSLLDESSDVFGGLYIHLALKDEGTEEERKFRVGFALPDGLKEAGQLLDKAAANSASREGVG